MRIESLPDYSDLDDSKVGLLQELDVIFLDWHHVEAHKSNKRRYVNDFN